MNKNYNLATNQIIIFLTIGPQLQIAKFQVLNHKLPANSMWTIIVYNWKNAYKNIQTPLVRRMTFFFCGWTISSDLTLKVKVACSSWSFDSIIPASRIISVVPSTCLHKKWEKGTKETSFGYEK